MLITCSIMLILRPTRSKYGTMILSPGVSVWVYLPNRSMVQSQPCGTVLTPENRVAMTSRTRTIAKTSKPDIFPSKRDVRVAHQMSARNSLRTPLLCLCAGGAGSPGRYRTDHVCMSLGDRQICDVGNRASGLSRLRKMHVSRGCI